MKKTNLDLRNDNRFIILLWVVDKIIMLVLFWLAGKVL